MTPLCSAMPAVCFVSQDDHCTLLGVCTGDLSTFEDCMGIQNWHWNQSIYEEILTLPGVISSQKRVF